MKLVSVPNDPYEHPRNEGEKVAFSKALKHLNEGQLIWLQFAHAKRDEDHTAVIKDVHRDVKQVVVAKGRKHYLIEDENVYFCPTFEDDWGFRLKEAGFSDLKQVAPE